MNVRRSATFALPPFEKMWDFENGFHLTATPTRIAKIVAHWELFKMASAVPGAIVECGVFKGASFSCFASFRNVAETDKPMVGFDIFGTYPATQYEADIPHRDRFIESAGVQSIAPTDLMEVLRRKGCDGSVELVAGDITETVPAYVDRHPDLSIALLHVDVDIYEPTVTILEHLYPRIVEGGVLVLDDYHAFPGETDAVDEYFASHGIAAPIERFPFRPTPCYSIKRSAQNPSR